MGQKRSRDTGAGTMPDEKKSEPPISAIPLDVEPEEQGAPIAPRAAAPTTPAPTLEAPPIPDALPVTAKPLEGKDVNAYIEKLVRGVLPLTTTSQLYSTIFKDVLKSKDAVEYEGAIAFWALWNAGVRDRVLMCRDEKEDSIQYLLGAAASKIWKGGKPPFTRFKLGTGPEPGDILFLTNGPLETQMLCMFMGVAKKAERLDDGTVTNPVWTVVEVTREREDYVAKLADHELVVRTMNGRGLLGWLSPSSLKIEAPAK